MLERTKPAAQRGFTLIELLIVMAVVAILTMLAVPNFAAQLRNAQVRTVAEALQNDLRLAQAQAIAQNRQVEFALSTAMSTTAAPTPAAVAGNTTANYWFAATIPLLGSDAATYVASGSTGGGGSTVTGVSITAPASNPICFSPSGRLTALSSNAATVTCAAPASSSYAVASTSAAGTLTLNVTVKQGGQIRVCNPAASHAGMPDACT